MPDQAPISPEVMEALIRLIQGPGPTSFNLQDPQDPHDKLAMREPWKPSLNVGPIAPPAPPTSFPAQQSGLGPLKNDYLQDLPFDATPTAHVGGVGASAVQGPGTGAPGGFGAFGFLEALQRIIEKDYRDERYALGNEEGNALTNPWLPMGAEAAIGARYQAELAGIDPYGRYRKPLGIPETGDLQADSKKKIKKVRRKKKRPKTDGEMSGLWAKHNRNRQAERDLAKKRSK